MEHASWGDQNWKKHDSGIVVWVGVICEWLRGVSLIQRKASQYWDATTLHLEGVQKSSANTTDGWSARRSQSPASCRKPYIYVWRSENSVHRVCEPQSFRMRANASRIATQMFNFSQLAQTGRILTPSSQCWQSTRHQANAQDYIDGKSATSQVLPD